MKNYRLLPLVLVGLPFLAACNLSSVSELPLIAQFLPSTPTLTPLPSPTFAATLPPIPTPTTAVTPTATPSSAPRPTFTALEIARGDTSRPWIALTFDVGASIDPWPSILETLRQKDVRCTFFLTGDTLRKPEAPDLLRQALADGHELGNHSDTHPDFTQLTDEEIAQELAALDEMVIEITGISTKPYFRPPSGARNDRVWRAVQENGYVTIYWTYHVWDWTEDRTAEKVYSYAIEGACNGAIVVMHVGAWETADTLPAIIDELRARGYRLVTLSELLSP